MTDTRDPGRQEIDPGARPRIGGERPMSTRIGVIREFLAFLKMRKKLWLTPIVVVLVVLGALILFTSTSVAPFIYTLF